MEGNAPLSLHRKPTASSDRFIPLFSNSAPSTTLSSASDELSEDDVFWTGDFAESSHHPNLPSTSSTPPFHHHNNTASSSKGGFNRAENFGILAALPEANNRSVFNHKMSISPSSSSSARMIPVLPRPPVERQSSSVKYRQSAPVSVPMMLREDQFRRYEGGGFDYEDDEEEEEDDDAEMLPPHEIVARQSANSPVLSCSVLEGAGRTLKGRDLRQVRNAVFRQTELGGFGRARMSFEHFIHLLYVLCIAWNTERLARACFFGDGAMIRAPFSDSWPLDGSDSNNMEGNLD
ncbi:hypothetical protein Ancab_011275 [Ancistrocladus abbreviatus]